MKKTCLTILPLFLVLSLACSALAVVETEFLKDPSVEEGVGLPDYWLTWSSVSSFDPFEMDPEVSYTGQNSLRITVDDGSYAVFFQYMDPAKFMVGKDYKARVYVRTQDVVLNDKGEGADLCIISKNSFGGVINPVYETEAVSGTKGWQKIIVTFQKPENANEISIGARLNYANGIAWFDDFAIWAADQPEPTVAPTVAPTATPVPTKAPTPTKAPSVTQAPTMDITPTEALPSPTEIPSPTKAEATDSPTPTIEPTPTQVPTDSLATPSPEPTSSPAPASGTTTIILVMVVVGLAAVATVLVIRSRKNTKR